MELTLEKAKELSEKKWQFIVDNKGNRDELVIELPQLALMRSQCSMCEYQIKKSGNNRDFCDGCLYSGRVCSNLYAQYLFNKTSKTAKKVLDAIIEINNK